MMMILLIILVIMGMIAADARRMTGSGRDEAVPTRTNEIAFSSWGRGGRSSIGA
jgi:hypothetical protein